MINCDNEVETRLDDIKGKFDGYYSGEHDPFGNNVGKLNISQNSVRSHYINFFKTCRIMEKLFMHRFTSLSEYQILDAGCGNGQDLRTLMEFGALPHNCHGIDFSEPAIKHARQASPPSMNFHQVSFLNNGFEDAKFDIIYTYNTITNHIDDDIKNIGKEFRRIIKPDGIFLLICTLDNAPRNVSGVAGLTARTFTLDQIRDFFPQFKIVDMASASVLKDDFEKNIVVTDKAGNKANLNVLFNWANALQEQQSYNQFYISGALKQMVYGMEIIKSGLQLIVLRPEPVL